MKYYMEEPGDWSKEMWKMDIVEPAVWVPVEISTGKIDGDFEQYDDELRELSDGWEWKKFALTIPFEELLAELPFKLPSCGKIL